MVVEAAAAASDRHPMVVLEVEVSAVAEAAGVAMVAIVLKYYVRFLTTNILF